MNCKVKAISCERASETGIIVSKTGKYGHPDRFSFGDKMFDIGISSSMWHNMYIPQHIYFLSHRKYERGDWVLFSNEIVRATAEMVRLRNAAKVEASTDASLKVYKIPTSFVQRYVLRGGQKIGRAHV